MASAGVGAAHASKHRRSKAHRRKGKAGKHGQTQPSPGEAMMTSCPTNGSSNPFPSNTPYTFKGIVPNGPAGARVRLEYIDPNSANGIDTVKTTLAAGGTFTDTHSFPSTGHAYQAAVTPRYPDNPLSPGMPCSFTVM